MDATLNDDLPDATFLAACTISAGSASSSQQSADKTMTGGEGRHGDKMGSDVDESQVEDEDEDKEEKAEDEDEEDEREEMDDR